MIVCCVAQRHRSVILMSKYKYSFMADILKINRAKWKTGSDWGKHRTGYGDTELLNSDGYMCCLGFRCNQLGIPKKDLLGVPTPEDTQWEIIPDLIDGEYARNTTFCKKAMDINDNPKITRKLREQKITELFKKAKVKVVFTGKYKEPDTH